jgi:alkaline phosphatase D
MKPTKTILLCFCALVIIVMESTAINAQSAKVFMADGIKIGEVTGTRAIIWTRLTAAPERNRNGIPWATTADRVPTGHTLAEMADSVTGASGDVRLTCWRADAMAQPDARPLQQTAWLAVDTTADFTRQFTLNDLSPATTYILRIEGRAAGAKDASCKIDTRFQTAPAPDDAAPLSFTVVTGQDFWTRDDPDNGLRIFPLMLRLAPDFFVHTGDNEYFDRPKPFAKNMELARYKWNRIYALPFQREFLDHIPAYFMKDDHDTLKDDSWPGETYGDLTWDEGKRIFLEEVPMGESTYRTFRWGRDLQIWLVEGRDFRSPNNMPDGPDKTIWGAKQKQWFKRTVRASDATFRILITPTPLVGPDRSAKNDNLANKGFTHEGNEQRAFVAAQKNMYVITGDRHWQYVSVDPKTGLREYSCGPTSNAHAGGWKEEDLRPMHRYLNVQGGFLLVKVERETGAPRIHFLHYDTQGKVCHEDVLPVQ